MAGPREKKRLNCYLCGRLRVSPGSAFCTRYHREVQPSEARKCKAYRSDGRATGGWGDVIPQTMTVTNKYGQATVRV